MSSDNPQTLVGETRVRPPALLCAACRFWAKIEGDTQGECRIDPPRRGCSNMSARAFWPNTDPDKWCGRHEPHPATVVDGSDDPETMSIYDLGIPGRARRALIHANIRTVGQLTRQTAFFVLTLNNIGVGTLERIKQALANKGLSLKYDGETRD